MTIIKPGKALNIKYNNKPNNKYKKVVFVPPKPVCNCGAEPFLVQYVKCKRVYFRYHKHIIK
jgi:hypothetical protein